MKKKDKSKKHEKTLSRLRLWAFAVIAAAVTGYLFFQSRSETDPVPSERPAPGDVAAAQAPKTAFSAGDVLPEVSLLSLTGERLELRAPVGAHQVLLYIFSPRCSICHETLPVWKELFEEATSQSVEVIGISALGPMQTANYVRQFQIPWSVFCIADQASMEALRLKRIPVTILVGGDGEIALAMQGRIGSEQKILISQHLHETGE